MQQPQQPVENAAAANITPSEHVQRRFDLYSIEIKSKIIAMFFKFFQREEHIIYKMAKKCLAALLRKEQN